MPRASFDPTTTVLEALRTIVADHGDAFRFSVSKRGRIWLTLTHWDTEKYNTSVEVDPMGDIHDVLSAIGVLCVAHKGKCFGNVEHSDSWLGVEATRSLANDALDVLRFPTKQPLVSEVPPVSEDANGPV